MPIIKRIKILKSVGIFADLAAKDESIIFRRYNLIYGFNGSGKSTLSRIFASLQIGSKSEGLPDESIFEIEMDDNTSYKCPNTLTGLEKRVCVFNTDFIDQNLQWTQGRATSIFYISRDQATLAEELRIVESSLVQKISQKETAKKIAAAHEKEFKTYRTERARAIAGAIHLGNRRYEASQLQSDYDKYFYQINDILNKSCLDEFIDLVRSLIAKPQLSPINNDFQYALMLIQNAYDLGNFTLGKILLAEFNEHPLMLTWIRSGLHYHIDKDLQDCLLCGNEITKDRKNLLTSAIDNKVDEFISKLHTTKKAIDIILSTSREFNNSWPKPSDIDFTFQNNYQIAITELQKYFDIMCNALEVSVNILDDRLLQPTKLSQHPLPNIEELTISISLFDLSISKVNEIIEYHNMANNDFSKRQNEAREMIKKHFLSDGYHNYTQLSKQSNDAQHAFHSIENEISIVRAKITELSGKVKSHGPAAERITRLVQSYLGHGELTIVAANEGYELHRHGNVVKGPPSEGEKTAIALCYFISTLESNGRNINELIVIMDDPISSLDTRAMNYACALVRMRLSNVAQVFILTHNQHCMNEFKKAWRSGAEKEKTPPTATLLYMDTRILEGSERRTTKIVLMPGHLRGYDSEYHFLCNKVLQFEAVGAGHSEYWFMMPNVIRRVLELFLAFKVPGSDGIVQKLDALIKRHSAIDPIRVVALNRLIHVESHTDSLEDLITHSPMTVEETRDANTALLDLMKEADEQHTKAIRKQCRAV